MFVVTEFRPQETIERLSEAWSRPPTFAFLPGRSSFTPAQAEEALRALPEPLQRDHFALLTSGSTGVPKLVIGSRARSEHLTDVLHEVQHSGPVRETILTLPLSYCYAFVNQFLWARTQSRRLVLTGGLAMPGLLLEALKDADHAMLCLVGSQVPLLMEHTKGNRYPGVIRVHFAGGRFPQERLDDLRALFPEARVFNNYGCAEAMPRLTIRPAEANAEGAVIGKPIPGAELSASPQAELLFRSVYRAVGQIVNEVFEEYGDETWLPTGDLGMPMPDGQWRLLGRANEVFKRFGEKIAVPIIAATINPLWTGQLASYRERDQRGEEGYVFVLCPQPEAGVLNGMLQALQRSHPRTHWPLRIESVGKMPSLANGKIDSNALSGLPERVVHWRLSG